MPDYIFPPNLALQALRSGDYADTVYALAELIDNSYDAQATKICVVLRVEEGQRQPNSIAVFDNGVGMNIERLRHSIQFGYGMSHHLRGKVPRRKNLGKFGVGLVAASVNQCTHLELFSWQNGEPAMSTELNLDNNDANADNTLPDPVKKPLPAWCEKAFTGMPEPISVMQSGTLVVWHNVEPSWKKTVTLQEKVAELCGRIYRTFITHKQLAIFINQVDAETGDVKSNKEIEPVDPMFLNNWNIPPLTNFGFENETTLFIPYTGMTGDSGRNQEGNTEGILNTIKITGEEVGSYILEGSYRRPEVMSNPTHVGGYPDPGNAPYGQLARRLQGVSVLRAGREILLDPAWLRTDKTVDRWVSVSLDFDPSLDEVFGVTNNKQSARKLSMMASFSFKELKKKLKDAREDEDTDELELRCIEVAVEIKELLTKMEGFVKAQRKGTRTGSSPEPEDIRDPVHATIQELQETSRKLSTGGADLEYDHTDPADDPDGTKKAYEGTMVEGVDAGETRPEIVIENRLKVDYVNEPYARSQAFFDIAEAPGHIVIKLQGNHPVSDSLSRLLTRDDDPDSDTPLVTMDEALRVIRNLLSSYARAEVEAWQIDDGGKFEECRMQWGKVANRLFEDEDG